MKIEDISLENAEVEDLKAFAEAQQKTIIHLTKKIKTLEDENSHLKKLVEQTVPVIKKDGQPEQKGDKFLTSDQEAICRVQLNKLRDISFDRELTLEEAKQVEIFSKILNLLETVPKTIKAETKGINTEDLLNFLEEQANGPATPEQIN
jgi:hypothetical protein